MKGCNRFDWNQETMKAVVQAYLDSTLLKTPNQTVEKVEHDVLSDTFTIKMRDKNPAVEVDFGTGVGSR
jgi:hypothetical protein